MKHSYLGYKDMIQTSTSCPCIRVLAEYSCYAQNNADPDFVAVVQKSLPLYHLGTVDNILHQIYNRYHSCRSQKLRSLDF